jgi:dTDP-4-dehydrorhamnose 3,5-epimerase-like enzyme
MNAEALELTQQLGFVTFFSRTQQKLWTKGETSGNKLTVVNINHDCDNDTLLITALNDGPTCHLGRESCFIESPRTTNFITKLEAVIDRSFIDKKANSYTYSLFLDGIKEMAKKNNVVINQVLIQHTAEIKVSALLKLIQGYKNNYFESGEIPDLSNPFHKNIWNTFLCFLDHQLFYPFHLNLHTDNRGSFAETAKLKSGGQISFSTTAPGFTRGNHFHTRKSERFAVIKGQAKIEIRRIGTDLKHVFLLNGDRPSFVDMPIWFTHNITNIGDDDLYTIFWINEEYDSSDPDTYFEEV